MDNRQNGHTPLTPRGKGGRPSIPPDPQRCTALSKQTRGRCRNYREPGRVVCRFHGGATPVGIASPHTDSGRYSRLLPKRLLERFEALAGDEEILNLGRDLALLDLRAEELLGRIDTGESATSWQYARDALARLRGAMTDGNGQGIRDAMSSLQTILSDAAGRESTWRDLRDLLQERRLIVESERRRLVDLHQTVTVEELLLFARAIVNAVNRHVTDRAQRTAVALEIRDLTQHAGRAPQTVASYAVTPGNGTVIEGT